MRSTSFRRGHREAEVSTDSLNDIMFFLLLFFLILSTMVSPNSIKVNLASSKPKTDLTKNNKPVHMAVTNDRKYFIDNKEVSLNDIEAVIADKIKGMTEPTLVMHLDKDLTIQDEVDILQICDRLKCKPILATKPTHGN
ncbi:MAG TPA: biopolymer transporter ExbD [Bacteroidia bacterium]|jgi:biopolymer transport protein ExbD|nr:biopolymer transporter ExbD [Bacteroidia bacterium]